MEKPGLGDIGYSAKCRNYLHCSQHAATAEDRIWASGGTWLSRHTTVGQSLGVFKLIQTRVIPILPPENGNFVDLN